MLFTLWMVMPQTQGATYLYLHYLHPAISVHERDLDNVLIHIHSQIKSKGGQYIEASIAWFWQIIFGTAATGVDDSTKSGNVTQDASQLTGESYVSALFSRFRTSPIGAYPDAFPSSFFNFLNTNVKHAGDIIPAHLSPEDRVRYVNQQRAKVQEWLHMLDAAARTSPVEIASSRPPSRNVSRMPSAQQLPGNLTYRAPPGTRTPTAGDSDYEDLGKDETLQSAPVQQQRSTSWFFKNRSD